MTYVFFLKRYCIPCVGVGSRLLSVSHALPIIKYGNAGQLFVVYTSVLEYVV